MEKASTYHWLTLVSHSVTNVKSLVASRRNQEMVLIGPFSVIMNLRVKCGPSFEALISSVTECVVTQRDNAM